MNVLHWLLVALLYPLISSSGLADSADPVKVFGKWKDAREKTIGLELGLDIQEHGFRIYKESVKIKFLNHTPTLNLLPAGEKRLDKFTRKVKEVYLQSVHWPVNIDRDPHAGREESVDIEISYRACNDIVCHFPKLKHLHLSANHPEQRS